MRKGGGVRGDGREEVRGGREEEGDRPTYG